VLHVHPPAPSTLNPEVTAAEDELCRRLLAKDPADRFQSANEVVGAIRLLLPDTSRTTDTAAPRKPRTWMPWVAVAAIVAMSGVAAVMWKGPSLPAAPPDAEKWYRQGTEAIREGAYDSARKALLQAVALYPQYALAYARLAEADAELDDGRAAKDHLLQLSRLVPDESRLPVVERLRIAALRALVLRDVDVSADLYKQILDRTRDDAGAWLDLGRAQETAGRRSDARASYEGAIARDREYAAAYLHLGVLQALEGREEAMATFAEAERLYRARSYVEGETEVLLRRGMALDAAAEVKAARRDLERALMFATNAGNLSQRVRTKLGLSSVTSWEGHFDEAQRLAADAVAEALKSGLDTVAAGGLVTLAGSLNDGRRYSDAQHQAERAIELADRQVARFTAAAARVQLASIFFESERFKEALSQVATVLPFLKENRYRRLELSALLVASRAHQSLDELDVARQQSADGLTAAELLKDDVQIARAAGTRAGVITMLGQLPEALRLRERAESINRRLGDQSGLPYEIANRADLLARLGRGQEAEVLFREIDAGIAAGLDSYKGRAERVRFLRAFEAATGLRCEATLRLLGEPGTPARVGASALEPVLRSFCGARLRRRAPVDPAPLARTDPSQAREGHYWLAYADIMKGDAASALAHARTGLQILGDLPNDELRWRLTTVGAIAARRAGDADADAMAAEGRRVFERLRAAWQADFGSYERRSDLADLRHRAGGT
ncbi:MAG TPA: hypothetical protein VN716_28965, partial [Vicinamibacterales bacterium]|nr:hypothetical protein [Vicinamibacterales bacterium]